MVDLRSVIYDGFYPGQPNWGLADSLIKADTDEKISAFASKNPYLLPCFWDYDPVSMDRKFHDQPIYGEGATIVDYKMMRKAMICALRLRGLASDESRHNVSGFSAEGVEIYHRGMMPQGVLRLEFEQCEYCEWLKSVPGTRFDGNALIVESWAESIPEAFQEIALTIFDELVTNHLYNVRVTSSLGRLSIGAEDGIESAWLGLLEKTSDSSNRVGVCLECGKPFIATNDRGKPRRFCDNGNECKTKYNNRKALQRRKERKEVKDNGES